MKTKEEIDELYHKLYSISIDGEDNLHYYSFVEGYTQCQEDMVKDQTVTRFEVIDEHGRAYTDHYCKVELSYQDDGRTLKVFIKPLKQD
jgi:hypothetical protein